MIKTIIKRITFSLVSIYTLDLILNGFGLTVPINIYTLTTVAILGFPGLIMLALSFFFLIWKSDLYDKQYN